MAKNETQKLVGSCQCGGVRYTAEGPLELVARCHCRSCRKASGAEFSTNGDVQESSFHLESGEELLRSFESSVGQERIFCQRCGSPVFKRNSNRPGRLRLRLGLLDTEIEERPMAHVFVSEMARYSTLENGLPSFETTPDAEKKTSS